MENSLSFFENRKIRSYYHAERDRWYFSVIDIVAALTNQEDFKRAKSYWSTLKSRLVAEGSEVVTKCDHLKMIAPDGKMRLTDVADPETILRLVQSIPSPKAEPFKLWLARVGNERIQEISDPELSLQRARENWLNSGRSEKWVQARMSGQDTRNKLTDYWGTHGVNKETDFAMLTNIIHKEWTGLNVVQHKELKGLKKQNLRDHMNEAELLFTALAELSTRQIAETDKAKGVAENSKAAKKGGRISREAREKLELQTGKSVVTGENFLPPEKQRAKLLTKNNKQKNNK
jgi:hypothetical protein